MGDAPESFFTAVTDDGIVVCGVRFGQPSPLAFVVGHGFCGNWRNVVPLAKRLACRGTVYAFDFRGHGSSDGVTTLGDLEALDVRAVVDHVRRECGPDASVVTIGASMGGIAVLREAATSGCADAVVSISAPAQWMNQGRRAKLLGKLVTSRSGRAIARRYLSTRVAAAWTDALPPVELVRRIKKPMLFVHGADDHFVKSEQARALAHASDGRARLRVIAHYGHAEAGFSDERVVDVIDHEIEELGFVRTTPRGSRLER